MSRYLSRKFIAAMSALGCVQWALFEGLIDGDVYRTVIVATVAAYIAGNVTQKAVEK